MILALLGFVGLFIAAPIAGAAISPLAGWVTFLASAGAVGLGAYKELWSK